MYQHLRSNGYYVEVLGEPITCFDAKQYGTLLIVDPEEEFFPDEIIKLRNDYENGLSIIIFADWYNVTVMQKVKFFDENTRQWWLPVTGGANLPALNDLLEHWDIAFGDKVYEGNFKIGTHEMYYASGTSIIKHPKENFIAIQRELNNQGLDILKDKKIKNKEKITIFGLLNNDYNKKFGRLSLYGDSNCLDSAHLQNDCFWMLDALLQFSTTGQTPTFVEQENPADQRKYSNIQNHIEHFIVNQFNLTNSQTNKPARLNGSQLFKYSKVIDESLKFVPIKNCLNILFEKPNFINITPMDNLQKTPKLLLTLNNIDDYKLLDISIQINSNEINTKQEEEINRRNLFEWPDSKMAKLFGQMTNGPTETDSNYSLYLLLFVLILIILILLKKHTKRRISCFVLRRWPFKTIS